MSIKELVLQMKCRPYAFVAKKEIAFVSCFISGFLYSNIMSGRISAEDIAFKSFFSNWVKKELEKQRQLEYEVNRNYVFYISESYPTEEERVDALLHLCERFFAELENP